MPHHPHPVPTQHVRKIVNGILSRRSELSICISQTGGAKFRENLIAVPIHQAFTREHVDRHLCQLQALQRSGALKMQTRTRMYDAGVGRREGTTLRHYARKGGRATSTRYPAKRFVGWVIAGHDIVVHDWRESNTVRHYTRKSGGGKGGGGQSITRFMRKYYTGSSRIRGWKTSITIRGYYSSRISGRETIISGEGGEGGQGGLGGESAPEGNTNSRQNGGYL